MARRKSEGAGKSRALQFLSLGLVASIFASGLIYQARASYQDAVVVASARDTVVVVRATRDLHVGSPIVADDLEEVEVDVAYLPTGDEGLSHTVEELVGRVPAERILAQQWVPEARLADAAAHRGMHALVPPGMRALSLPLKDGAALSGLLQPGSSVDILVDVPLPKKPTQTKTFTIVKAVHVLGVNGQSELEAFNADPRRRRSEKRPKSSVTLVVAADDAERVVHANQKGTVFLVARAGDEPRVAQPTVEWPLEDTGIEAPGVSVPAPPAAVVAQEEEMIKVLITICRGLECDVEEHAPEE